MKGLWSRSWQSRSGCTLHIASLPGNTALINTVVADQMSPSVAYDPKQPSKSARDSIPTLFRVSGAPLSVSSFLSGPRLDSIRWIRSHWDFSGGDASLCPDPFRACGFMSRVNALVFLDNRSKLRVSSASCLE